VPQARHPACGTPPQQRSSKRQRRAPTPFHFTDHHPHGLAALPTPITYMLSAAEEEGPVPNQQHVARALFAGADDAALQSQERCDAEAQTTCGPAAIKHETRCAVQTQILPPWTGTSLFDAHHAQS
jgi:hypothetical protein